MKFEVKIKEMSHDELVNLFSTALYGNTAFACDYSKEERDKVFDKNDCIEDIIAKILLNSGSVDIIDRHSEEGDEPYSEYAYWDECWGNYVYPITLDDVFKGLELASEDEYGNKHFMAFINQQADMIDADVLMQYICYGEAIYG